VLKEISGVRAIRVEKVFNELRQLVRE